MGIVHAKVRRNAMGIDPLEVPYGAGHQCEAKTKGETRTLDLTGIPARVDRVTVEGLTRTKDDIVQASVKELFTAGNFEEVLREAHLVRNRLMSLGCFKNIGIHIDTSAGPRSTPNGYEVIYEVVEMKRLSGGVTTHVSDNEGVLTVGGFLPNIYGRGESLKGEVSYGSRRSNNINLSYVKPNPCNPQTVRTFSIFQNDNEWPMSGYKVLDRGIMAEWAFNSKPKYRHKIQWEGDWRQLGAGNKYASFEVRENAGSTLKSAIRHIVQMDTRDHPSLPTCGRMMRLATEIAGLGGNVRFFKNEINLQGNWPLGSDQVVIQATLNAGLLNPLEENEANVADMFFLGGPLSLRGFEFRGVGPQSDGNFTGGKLYWSSGLHLFTPLPFRPGSGGFGDLFKLHGFVNVGNLGDFNLEDPMALLKEQVTQIRGSVGIGLALKLGSMARVELNCCWPFISQENDAVQNFQLGVGVDFV